MISAVERQLVSVFNAQFIFAINAINLYIVWKKNDNHKKETIDAFVPIDLKCPNHPKIPLNLFCLDEMGKILY